jgi:citronellyl-CoA dehydrogenase
MRFTDEHGAIRHAVAQFIDKEINPHCDAWEEAGIFPAHEVFRKLGDLGFLGICKPTEYGGMGLDYSYQIVFSEELGRIRRAGLML